MIAKLIEWSLRNRFLVACAALLLTALGVFAVRTVPIDAIPDLSENQVIVFADWPGRSPQEVEDQVTYPLTTNLQGLAGVKTVRASSMFGFSLVTVIFQDKIDNYFARTRILERLNYLGSQLPAGVVPRLGPDATGLGWVYQYYLKVDPAKAPGGGYDLGRLRSVQDYFLRYGSPGCRASPRSPASAVSCGNTRSRLARRGCGRAAFRLQEVMDAVAQSNLNVGGKTLEENGAGVYRAWRRVGELGGRSRNHRPAAGQGHAGIFARRCHRADRRRLPARRARRQRPGSRRRHRRDAVRRERVSASSKT